MIDPFTDLGPGGYPKAPYGSFVGKPGAGSKVQPRCSTLGPGGYPKVLYGNFGGRIPVVSVGEPHRPTYFGGLHNFARAGSG
jgi:hypothetical protein